MERIGFGIITVVVLLICDTSPGQERQNPIPIIDVHAHSIPPDLWFQQNPASSLFTLKSMFGCPAADTFEQLMKDTGAQWDQNNVKLAVVSGFRSKHVLEWKKRSPDRIICSFNPPVWSSNWRKSDHQKSSETWGKEVDEGKWGAMGELMLAYLKMRPDEEFMLPYYAVAEKKGVPVFFHSGSPPGAFLGECSKPHLLEEVAKTFPNLKIVVCHMGAFDYQQTITLMKSYKNVYTDNSGTNSTPFPPGACRLTLEAFRDAGLLDRVMFGSDQMVYPGLVSVAVTNTKAAGLSDDQLRKVLWSNAAKLFRVSADGKRMGRTTSGE